MTATDAPYGRKTDGTPKRKPGRPTNGNGNGRAVKRAAARKPAVTATEAASLLDRLQAECDDELRDIDGAIAALDQQIAEERAALDRLDSEERAPLIARRDEVERVRKALDV